MAALCLATFTDRLPGQTCPYASSGNPCVLTGQYDVLRDGYNPSETTITQSSVANLTNTRVLVVDTEDLPTSQYANPIYGQPLYVPGVTIGETSHNLLVGVTLNDTVFAWDADSPSCDTSSPPNCYPIWSLEGTPSLYNANLNPVGNALWYTDCGSSGTPAPRYTSLPYAGILSTPVIDAHSTSAHPVIYLTSYCQDGTGRNHWWLHEIDLTNGQNVDHTEINSFTAAGAYNADDIQDNGQIPFVPKEVLQRPGLLEVTGGDPSTLVYMSFGTGVTENNANDPYHGWLVAYSVNGSGNFNYCNGGSNGSIPACPTVSFVTSATGGNSNTGMPACDTSQTVGGSGEYQNQPNWCGHGSGIWMSGRGPVAEVLGDGNTHIYVGVGNGGFQNAPSGTNPQNWGESVVDLRYFPSSAPDAAPFQYFTPNGGPPVAPPLADSQCSGGGTCAYTFDVLNENDWDMSVSGILPFTDLSGNNRLVTFDKGGWGYVLAPGCLRGTTGGSCNPVSDGFTPGDPGNIFPFYGPGAYCPSGSGPQTTDCDRITSILFYGGFLYSWPSSERLTALQLSDTTVSPSGVAITSSGTTVTISSGGDFSTLVVAGDLITDTNSSSPDYGEQRRVTEVNYTGSALTTVTIGSAFSPDITTSGGDSFSYSGLFVTPIRDLHPTEVGYPGGSLVASSNAGASGTGIIWGLTQAVGSNQVTRSAGTLHAYSAVSAGDSDISQPWHSSEIFCAASYALPTVVHGQVFVPTYAINLTGSASTACPSSGTSTVYPSGILVYKPT